MEQREPTEADAEEADLYQQLLETDDPAEQAEILAFMKAQGLMPAGHGAAGRFQRAPGGRGQGAGAKPGFINPAEHHTFAETEDEVGAPRV